MTEEPLHRDVVVDGMKLHYAELGPSQGAGDRPPLLLLHGLTDSHLTWSRAAPLLATDRRVLMPDLFGCGLSERPDASYTLDWHTRTIARFIEELGLEQVDVVGHSFGGGVAQMLLLHCAPRIRRMVLVAAGGLGRDVGFWLKLATFPVMVELFGQPFMSFGTRRALGGARQSSSSDDLEALSAMNAVRGTARAFSRTVRDVIDFRGQTRLFSQRANEVLRLPPIRVFWGDKDTLIPIAHGRALVEATTGVELEVFSGAGHYLHQEQPEAFVRALRSFLDAPSMPAAALRAAPSPRAIDETSKRVSRMGHEASVLLERLNDSAKLLRDRTREHLVASLRLDRARGPR